MEIIDELEPVKRGGYGGAIGYLSYSGDLDTCIHIRTVVIKDGTAHIQAGGGTVADAKPAYEYEESVNKSKAVKRAIELAAAPARTGHEHASVLMVDNYDSFTYNLVQYLGELGAEIDVVRNDVATVDELLERAPDRVVVSPGPCTPDDAGISIEAMRRVPRGRDPDARRLPRPPVAGRGVRRHGHPPRADPRQDHDDRARRPGRLPRACAGALTVGRYHSLVVAEDDLPDCFEVTSRGGGVLDGHPPSRAAGRGRAVPPRVGAHRPRQGHAAQLPRRRLSRNR